jgi:hypothetical protein
MKPRRLLQRSSVVAGAITALILLAAIWWLHGRILHVRGELAAAAAVRERQLAATTRQTSLEHELSRRQDDIARIVRMVPAPADLEGVLSTLETEARRAGVVLAATARETAEDAAITGTAFRLVPFAVTATGEPEALVRFLHAAEHAPYLIGIADFSLQTAREERALPELSTGPTSGPPGFRQIEGGQPAAELSFTLLVPVRENNS